MNGLAVLLAIASFGQLQTGAQFGWELDRDDRLIFIVEIPPAEMVEMERDGYEVAQAIPFYLKSKIDGVLVRVGTSTPPRVPSEEEFKRNLNDKPVTRSPGKAYTISQADTAARFGWELDRDDSKFNFVVKVSGMKNGSSASQEIPNYVKGKIERVVVQVGPTDPPRVPTMDVLKREFESGSAALMASAPLISPSVSSVSDRNRIKQIDFPNSPTPRIPASTPSPNDLAQLSFPNSAQSTRNRDDPTTMYPTSTGSGLGQLSTPNPPQSLSPKAWLDSSSSQGQTTTNNSNSAPYQSIAPYQGLSTPSVGFGAGSGSLTNNSSFTNQNRFDQPQTNTAYPYNNSPQNGYNGNTSPQTGYNGNTSPQTGYNGNTSLQNGYNGNASTQNGYNGYMNGTSNPNSGYYPERLTNNQQPFEQRPNPYASQPNNNGAYAPDPYTRSQQQLPMQQRWESNPATRFTASDPYSIPNANPYPSHLADNSRNANPGGTADRFTQSASYIPPQLATPAPLQYDHEGNLLPTTAGSNLLSGLSASDRNYIERSGSKYGNDPNSLTREKMLPVFFLMSFVINLYLVVLMYKLLGRYRALLSSARSGSAAPYSQATL